MTEHKRLFITNGVFPVISIDESFVVATDRKWMKIVLAQFITNAVKYTFDEGKKVLFDCSKATGQGILLSVRDEGVGIPASDLNRVTKAFFTGENGRLTGESTGMGLYIASEVCDKLGHPLKIESELGCGNNCVRYYLKTVKSREADDSENNRETEGSNENL